MSLQRVLVIDDDLLIRRSIGRALRGYVVVATDGVDSALEALEADDGFAVILCDLLMPPGRPGMDLHAEVAQRWPHLLPRIVYMTGGTTSPDARRFIEQVANDKLDKPFPLTVLRELVQAKAQQIG